MSVTVATLDNADQAAEMFEQTVGQRLERERDAALSYQEALATKRRLEEKRRNDVEYVTVDLGGEAIPLEAIKPGTVLEIARRAIEAERQGDEEEMLLVTDQMIETFVQHCQYPDIFDRAFFNQFDPAELRPAFREWGQQSNGGPDAGN